MTVEELYHQHRLPRHLRAQIGRRIVNIIVPRPELDDRYRVFFKDRTSDTFPARTELTLVEESEP